MLGIILGIVTIGLGLKGFTPAGLPLSRTKSINGTSAKVTGLICIVLGAFFIVDGVFSSAKIVSMLSSPRPDTRPAVVNIKEIADRLVSLPPPIRRDKKGLPLVWDPELDLPKEACDESLDDYELAGRWDIVSQEIGGRKISAAGYYEFHGNHMRMVEGPNTLERTFELDPRSEPKRLDSRQQLSQGTVVFRAIYKIEGELLTISDWQPFQKRPALFVDRTTPENDLSLCVFRRAKK